MSFHGVLCYTNDELLGGFPLSLYLTGMETISRPVCANQDSVDCGDVAATCPGDSVGREKVAVKSNMFDFF